MSHSTSASRQHRRFRALDTRRLHRLAVPVADTPRARFLGLAWLDRADAPAGLLIPGCRSVHTFGMRFPIDVLFLDGWLRELSQRTGLPPRRIASERRASAVLEIPA